MIQLAATVALPLFGPPQRLTVSTSPLSISFTVGQNVMVLSSGKVSGGCTIVGVSLAGVTVMNTVAVSQSAGNGIPLSQTTYVKLSCPLKLVAGV